MRLIKRRAKAGRVLPAIAFNINIKNKIGGFIMNYKIYASNPAREKSEERSYETRELMIDDFNKLLHESEKKNRQVHHSMITKRNEEMILAVVVECEHADFETIDLGGTDETITICHSCGKEL